jgi:hypothetical protein
VQKIKVATELPLFTLTNNNACDLLHILSKSNFLLTHLRFLSPTLFIAVQIKHLIRNF